MRNHRPAEKRLPGRYSRHYYDVAMLAQSAIRAEALANVGAAGRASGAVWSHRISQPPVCDTRQEWLGFGEARDWLQSFAS
jgi:hypothetical protein